MEFRWMYLVYLLFALVVAGFLSYIGTTWFPYMRQMFVEGKVLRTGIGVNADIVARFRTNRFDANIPVYRLTFKFETREGIEVQSTLDRALDAEGVMRYAPGRVVKLKYDPKNPKRIGMDDIDKPLILGD